jgi:hypothetical protein
MTKFDGEYDCEFDRESVLAAAGKGARIRQTFRVYEGGRHRSKLDYLRVGAQFEMLFRVFYKSGRAAQHQKRLDRFLLSRKGFCRFQL